MAEFEAPGATQTTGESTQGEIPPNHGPIKVTVNNLPVQLTERKVTGQQIINAAIAQGVDIEPDFVLSREVAPGKFQIVGADEQIEIHRGERFRANAPDDNS